MAARGKFKTRNLFRLLLLLLLNVTFPLSRKIVIRASFGATYGQLTPAAEVLFNSNPTPQLLITSARIDHD